MKVHLLLTFLSGILNAFALTDKHEEESKESSDQALKFLKGSAKTRDDRLGPRLENRIIRGKEATKNGYPWMASFRINGSHFCAGSFIGDKYVLTAAKCLNFEKAATGEMYGWTLPPKNNSKELPFVKVVLGDHYVSTTEPEEQIFHIADFIALEPVTNRSGVGLRNDVAVVKLDRPAKLTKYVSAIRLSNSSMGVSPGDVLTVAGWGISKRPIYNAKQYVTLPEKFSNVLRVAQTTVIPNQKCANLQIAWNKGGSLFILAHPAGEDYICTKEKNDQGQPSRGDFGDPLMHCDPKSKECVQLGIYSYRWGRKSELGHSYVPYFYDKIHLMMKELENKNIEA